MKESERTQKLVALAKEMGIGDGTYETILVTGIHMMINEAEEAMKKGHTTVAITNLINSLKGIATYLARDNEARKEAKHV